MEVEPKLAALIDRIFQQNLERRDFNSVIGLAFDTRRIDMVEAAINSNEAEKNTLFDQIRTSCSKDSPENEETKPSPENNNLKSILSGDETIKHHMQFLIKNNHTDMLILKNIKDVDRGSCAHNATVIANGLMHTGTTCDDVLSLVIYFPQGHEREARKILDPYLPRGDVDPYGFKGGALCVYGFEDEIQRDRVSANNKNQLESYCFNIKQTMEDDK
uniref:26S proteasome non-ATPase regulatory subunit 1/RPN2 N-terminal domain-containing protein n=1 Tax=Meloidogyne floridensis TaxID=298350 RepID=A0A915P7F8_9BILA